jgi:LysM repeat protein
VFLLHRQDGRRCSIRRSIVNTLKSTAVILVLAGVLYGVYTALNKPEMTPPPGMTSKEVEDMGPPAIDFEGGSGDLATSLPAPPSTIVPSAEAPSPAPPLPRPGAGGVYAPPSETDSAASKDLGPTADAATSPAGDNRQLSFETPAAGEVSPAVQSPATPQAASPSLAAFELRRELEQAEQHVAENKFRAALAGLSPYYNRSELPAEDRALLIAWLDALAAKVIYSREHLLEAPYLIRGSETLFDIAQRSQVTAELLQNINGINDPRVLVPGTELKIVPGPMRAEVNLTMSELTLFLGNLYAGRFPFTLGDEPPQPGQYEIRDRQLERTYYGADGRTIPANDPTNPYGQCWLDLGTTACIHGSPLALSGTDKTRGCISLSPKDATDVYSILARGSQVVITR